MANANDLSLHLRNVFDNSTCNLFAFNFPTESVSFKGNFHICRLCALIVQYEYDKTKENFEIGQIGQSSRGGFISSIGGVTPCLWRV